MNLLRLMGDLTQLRREFRDLASTSVAEEEEAKYELTASARRFSRRTKHVVDDKLSFSATLMRAGEVHAANRLLEEVEQDVRTEEAALIETMNEVKVARATRRERMTRVRLARMLAVSLAGSLIMGFSALGMAAAGFVDQREQDQIRQNAAAQRRALAAEGSVRGAKAKLRGLDSEVRKLLKANVPLGAISSLSPGEIRRFNALTTSGSVDVGQLQSFLTSVLPTSDLAREVAAKIVDRVHDAVASAEEAAGDVATLAPRVKRKAQKAEERTSEEPAAEEAEPSPSPDESPSPPEEEERTERDGRQQETGGNGGGDGDGDNSGLPGAGSEELPLGD